MTLSYRTPTTVTSRRRPRRPRRRAGFAGGALGPRRPRRRAGFAGGALAMFFALLLVPPAASAAAATATTVGSQRSISGHPNAEPAHPIAHISATDEAETEEVTEEGGEAAASLEAEAEEAETEEVEAGEAAAAASGAQPGAGAALSDLRLTRQTNTALRHRRPVASAVGFSFTLSAPAKVRVTLVKQTVVAGLTHWVALPNSLTLTAVGGQNHRSLKGHNRLSPGRYHLTVKPAGGRSRSIYLSARA